MVWRRQVWSSWQGIELVKSKGVLCMLFTLSEAVICDYIRVLAGHYVLSLRLFRV